MDELHIAGWNTANGWRQLRAKLAPGGNSHLWENAFREYFRKRLETRYLNPIRTLREHDTYEGEGFSIVAIQCTLIEFLESTVRGTNYRYLRRGEVLGPHEYSVSSELFVAFLSTREPFLRTFTEAAALDFYYGVRCGLLHEARTKNDWTIWGKSPHGQVADTERHIVYRDNMQDALLEFINNFGSSLTNDRTLQEAFIRKFDKLCE